MSVWDPKQALEDLGLGEEKQQKRSVRVAEAIKMELATLLVGGVADPRLQTVSISRVAVSDDLSLASIYYTVFGGKKEAREAAKGFERASGFLRSHLAKTLNLRFTPSLRFFYDKIADKVAELDEIFDELREEREARGDDS